MTPRNETSGGPFPPGEPNPDSRYAARDQAAVLEEHGDTIRALLADLHERLDEIAADTINFHALLRRHPKPGGGLYSKNLLVGVYRELCERGELQPDENILRLLRMKPTRTVSGVAPVTVLTKPYPCPGECIFCPTDARMPKSYLPDEPGAMRAEQNGFDPYAQTYNRIRAFASNGHPVDKIELLILGGTWSSYPRDYQEEFVRRCLDAMNLSESMSLASAQRQNETASHRNVGLVIETRPDHVNPEEVRWLRTLGTTKVQLGAQSLDDGILELNRRGHDVESTRRAMTLLRAAGFKLVLHWMPNLHGATPASDLEDFQRLWSDPALRPDELKIYPCSLLVNAELHEVYQRGEYRPYEDAELVELVAQCKALVPKYCRVNRVYRDIPSTYIVAGCRITNLRETVQAWMQDHGLRCSCIRCREIRGGQLDPSELQLRDLAYETRATVEHFLSYETTDDRIAGYLRLGFPTTSAPDLGQPELAGAAIVREVHVYGPAQSLGRSTPGRAQHQGLGTRLIREAERRAMDAGFDRVAIIASVGTRSFYAERGYRLDGTYMIRELAPLRAARIEAAGR